MSLNNLKPVVRISIENPEAETHSVFGLGVAKLCKGVHNHGSLNAAAKSMGMAYSKAWRIVKETESALGTPLLVRDGAHGSTLTPECEQLLDLYFSLESDLQKAAEKQYRSNL